MIGCVMIAIFCIRGVSWVDLTLDRVVSAILLWVYCLYFLIVISSALYFYLTTLKLYQSTAKNPIA